MQRFWHRGKLQLIDRWSPPGPEDRCLDVGCGSGVVCDHLARVASRVEGVDGNARAIDFAQERFARANLHFTRGHVDEAFQSADPFDKAYCFEVIEHLHDPQVFALLRNVARVVRPGGRFLLTTPNYRSAWPLIESAMDRLHLAPPLAGAQHVNRFDAERLQRIVEESGAPWRIVRRGSKYLLSPWAAVLGERPARWLLDRELRAEGNLGCLLVLLLERVPS